MRDEIPNLTADERALLHRFRVDESPEPAVAARVLRGLSAQLLRGQGADTPTQERPWWLWLRAGGLSVAIAACGLFMIGGAARMISSTPKPTSTEAMHVAVPTTAPHPVAETPIPAAPAPEPAGHVAPAPEITTVPEIVAVPPETIKPRTRTTKPTTTPAATPIDSAAEIALFGAIKTERDASARLTAIAKYRRDFGKGAFAQEVAVLEIEALCKLGRTDDATARADAFVGRFGDSAYAAIARRGCAGAKP